MDEVEYCIVRKNSKLAADEIKKLPRGTILTEVCGCGCGYVCVCVCVGVGVCVWCVCVCGSSLGYRL